MDLNKKINETLSIFDSLKEHDNIGLLIDSLNETNVLIESNKKLLNNIENTYKPFLGFIFNLNSLYSNTANNLGNKIANKVIEESVKQNKDSIYKSLDEIKNEIENDENIGKLLKLGTKYGNQLKDNIPAFNKLKNKSKQKVDKDKTKVNAKSIKSKSKKTSNLKNKKIKNKKGGGCYRYIIHPSTFKKYEINTLKGKSILNNYILN